jgi:hypothetical protein
MKVLSQFLWVSQIVMVVRIHDKVESFDYPKGQRFLLRNATPFVGDKNFFLYVSRLIFRCGVDGVEKVFVRILIFGELGETQNTEHIDFTVVYHQSNVAHIASNINHVSSNFSPKDQINEYFEYFS